MISVTTDRDTLGFRSAQFERVKHSEFKYDCSVALRLLKCRIRLSTDAKVLRIDHMDSANICPRSPGENYPFSPMGMS